MDDGPELCSVKIAGDEISLNISNENDGWKYCYLNTPRVSDTRCTISCQPAFMISCKKRLWMNMKGKNQFQPSKFKWQWMTSLK